MTTTVSVIQSAVKRPGCEQRRLGDGHECGLHARAVDYSQAKSESKPQHPDGSDNATISKRTVPTTRSAPPGARPRPNRPSQIALSSFLKKPYHQKSPPPRQAAIPPDGLTDGPFVNIILIKPLTPLIVPSMRIMVFVSSLREPDATRCDCDEGYHWSNGGLFVDDGSPAARNQAA